MSSTSIIEVEIVNNNTPIYKGSAPANSDVYISINGSGAQYGLGKALGNGFYEIIGKPLPPGTHSMTSTELKNGVATDWSHPYNVIIA